MIPGHGWGGFCRFAGLGNLGWIGWVIYAVLGSLILLGLVLLVVWAVRRSTSFPPGLAPGSPQGSQGLTALDILQARYAKGEITREQYLQMLDDIR